MKTGILIAALTAVLLASGMTGISLAGNGINTGRAGIYDADPERASGWDYQILGPMETGALPEASGGASGSNGIASGDREFAFVESGGVSYRVGLDTGS
ncbi:MAG TPA: hypothetical protein DDX05_04555 [Deltaproteobacteria bacterium]|nr:MAG: hypothetical protein A2X90_10610 [Deltaproteobacteria bacterium GWA2_65_63]OGP29117.1 MAG: hypothetical protein A2X91_10995 [Deltaproteobacteria bacterium GWB2_65_81]HBG72883.1 hypothetical protein [Deltaproteobacteria bacterium]